LYMLEKQYTHTNCKYVKVSILFYWSPPLIYWSHFTQCPI